VKDALKILNSVKNNPYGIKITKHSLKKTNRRKVNLNTITEKLNGFIPVGVQKTLNYSNRFELIYEFEKRDDLYIIIDIENNEEVEAVTIIPKSIKRREH
jgi:hypothetical protein